MPCAKKPSPRPRSKSHWQANKVGDYDQEQLELIVKDQESKILQKYRNSAFVVVLLALGIA